MRRLVRELHARWRAFSHDADAIRASSIAIWSAIRRHATPDDRPMSSQPRLAWPVCGAVSSGFGMRHARLHEGIDIKQPEGTPVSAPLAGVVVLAEELAGYGNVVVLDHGTNLATVYAHLATIAVAPADSVAPGSKLGTVGTTGCAAGPHLHFEVRFDGTAVDPTVFLAQP